MSERYYRDRSVCLWLGNVELSKRQAEPKRYRRHVRA